MIHNNSNKLAADNRTEPVLPKYARLPEEPETDASSKETSYLRADRYISQTQQPTSSRKVVDASLKDKTQIDLFADLTKDIGSSAPLAERFARTAKTLSKLGAPSRVSRKQRADLMSLQGSAKRARDRMFQTKGWFTPLDARLNTMARWLTKFGFLWWSRARDINSLEQSHKDLQNAINARLSASVPLKIPLERPGDLSAIPEASEEEDEA